MFKQQNQPPQQHDETSTIQNSMSTLSTVMKCLMRSDITIQFADILKYTVAAITATIVLLILIPTRLILCLLIIILFIIFGMYIVYKTTNLRSSNFTPGKQISQDKLASFRSRLHEKRKAQENRDNKNTEEPTHVNLNDLFLRPTLSSSDIITRSRYTPSPQDAVRTVRTPGIP